MNDLIAGDIFVRQPRPQTLRAWEPFWDCVSILFSFQQMDIGPEYGEWKIHWIAGVSMLRCIGHVLEKVDSRKSVDAKAAIQAKWTEWKNDHDTNWIFFDFIEDERNNILKAYNFGARIEGESDENYALIWGDDQDALQVYRYAVYWWRRQLEEIESMILSGGVI